MSSTLSVSATSSDDDDVLVTFELDGDEWHPTFLVLSLRGEVVDDEATAAYVVECIERARERLDALVRSRTPQRGRPPKYDDAHFETVAREYAALLRDESISAPLAELAKRFDVTYSVAAHWVARCRRVGLL